MTHIETGVPRRNRKSRRYPARSLRAPSFAVSVLIAIASVAAGADIPPTGKPIKLFDGKNLKHFDTFLRDKGFNSDPEGVFRVENGVVHVSGKEYGYFITKEDYGDYYLRLEFKWGDATYAPREGKARDAGILYHVVGENKVWPRSLEFQMIEGGTGDILVVGGGSLTVNGETKTRGRFDRFGKGPWQDIAGYRDPRNELEKPHGEWNLIEMIADGGHVKYWVNGKVANEGSGAAVTRGRILFQSEGAEVFYRNIELRPLKK